MAQTAQAAKTAVQRGPRRVVIVGGGFGGLFAARALSRAPVSVTLVDRAHVTASPSAGCPGPASWRGAPAA
jgi:2-polyprenyl-6-methoxyphenol hydroxylase-like FAD-dependent oxidoreductase